MLDARITLTLAAALALTFAQSPSACAADATAWVQDLHSAFRLIAGSDQKRATVRRAGIEIKMDPGWHTYWRYAGDSGVPPRFDFSGSENVASVKVRYPAPHLFTDETGNTLGYKGSVIFPVEVQTKSPDAPVTLKVKIDYAVCEKLCVPAEGRAEISLVPGKSAEDATLKAAEASVPQPTSAASIGLAVKRLNDAAKPMVAVDFKLPQHKPAQVFVEGPTLEWALPIPQPAKPPEAGREQFTFELDGLPPGIDPRKGPFDLTFTIVAGEHAYEVRSRLD